MLIELPISGALTPKGAVALYEYLDAIQQILREYGEEVEPCTNHEDLF